MVFALLSKTYGSKRRFRVRLTCRDGDHPAINALQDENVIFQQQRRMSVNIEQSWCTFQNQVAHNQKHTRRDSIHVTCKFRISDARRLACRGGKGQ